MSNLLDKLHNICQFVSSVWVSLTFVDFAEFDVCIYTETSFQICSDVRNFILHRVVRIRLGFPRFKEVFELVNALLCVWLQSPTGREFFVLSDIRICLALTLRLLGPVLILLKLFFWRGQVRRQFFVFDFFLGT